MKKSSFYLILILVFVGFRSFAQDVSLDLQKPHEFTPAEVADFWKNTKTRVSFVGSSVRLPEDIPIDAAINKNWDAKSWKNEKIHTQLAISGPKSLKNIQVSLDGLKGKKGTKISAENIQIGFVEYVMTDEFRDGCGYRKSIDFDSSMVADRINTLLKSADLAANQTLPVWISVKVPAHTPAGIYKGKIKVKAGKTYKLNVNLEVSDKILPSPEDWKFRLDYWQHPASIARVHDLPLWSDAHFDKMREYYSMLAAAGQKVITASIVDEPWNHQTYDDYPSLVKWIKKSDGSWTYDYNLFDKYIEFVMSTGIKGQINCYSMVPWEIAFKYFDEKAGEEKTFTGAIGTPEYNEFWGTMLKDFTSHLKQKGWFDITTIAMDERPMEAMKSVIGLLKSIDKDWKISLAGDFHPEIEKDIFDYCVASRWTYPEEVLSERKSLGKSSTWYTCCTEKYPNEFTFSPPDEAVWTGWYTAATEMDGFLRWAFNSWTENPMEDSRFISWPAGDTYQVYPGPLSSIRFEKIIEGIQDFEKINYLRNSYKTHGEIEKLGELEAALEEFKIKKLSEKSAQQMIEKHKHLLF